MSGIQSRAPIFACALLAPSLALGQAGTRIGDYVFSLDGEPFQPEIIHLHGEPGRPLAGDVFLLHPYLIALGEEKDFDGDRRLRREAARFWETAGSLLHPPVLLDPPVNPDLAVLHRLSSSDRPATRTPRHGELRERVPTTDF